MGEGRFAYSFTKYCPLLLVLLILCNIFDVYGRILAGLGLSRFKFSENFDDEKIEEGRILIEKGNSFCLKKLKEIQLAKHELHHKKEKT